MLLFFFAKVLMLALCISWLVRSVSLDVSLLKIVDTDTVTQYKMHLVASKDKDCHMLYLRLCEFRK